MPVRVFTVSDPNHPNHTSANHSGHRDRLRERLLTGGDDGFHDYELLEYVLGLLIPRRDTKPLAKELEKRFGGLAAVLAAEVPALKAAGLSDTTVAGIKFIEATARRSLKRQVLSRAVLSSWAALIDYLHADMAHIIHERFRVLFLNNKNILIHDEVMSEGTVNHAPVYVRDIIKRALELGATALILVHNHPSGDPKPSQDDITMTKEIIDAGKRLSISVHDHVIIGKSDHVSFKNLGII